MAWWIIPLIMVASAAVSYVMAYALAPDPQAPQAAPAAGLNEFNVPTAELGRDIPVLFGTRKITAPNVVWYGDLKTKPIIVWVG